MLEFVYSQSCAFVGVRRSPTEITVVLIFWENKSLSICCMENRLLRVLVFNMKLPLSDLLDGVRQVKSRLLQFSLMKIRVFLSLTQGTFVIAPVIMYIYIRRYKMKRTQIYIDEKIYSHLEKESKAKGVSISELVRESIHEKITRKIEKILKATDDVCGIWEDRKFDVDGYIRNTRRERKAC
jgi:hypothetical protein